MGPEDLPRYLTPVSLAPLPQAWSVGNTLKAAASFVSRFTTEKSEVVGRTFAATSCKDLLLHICS